MKEILILCIVTALVWACGKVEQPYDPKKDVNLGVSKKALEKNCFGFDWCVMLDGGRQVVWSDADNIMDIGHFCKDCGGRTYLNTNWWKYGEAKHPHQCDKFKNACDRIEGMPAAIEDFCVNHPALCEEHYQSYCSNGDTDEPDGGVVMQDGGITIEDAGDTDTGTE